MERKGRGKDTTPIHKQTQIEIFDHMVAVKGETHDSTKVLASRTVVDKTAVSAWKDPSQPLIYAT